MAEYDGSHNFVALATIEEMHKRIDTLDKTLMWKEREGDKGWVLISDFSGRVLLLVWRTKDGLYRSGTKRPKDKDDEDDYNSSLFASLEECKRAGKIWMIKNILAENFRTHYVQ